MVYQTHVFYCALCSVLWDERLEVVEKKVAENPLSGIKNSFTCQGCGSKGNVVAKIKCIACGCEHYSGWYPQKS